MEKRTVKLACQNCGELVDVIIPFVGCVFCADCMKGETYNDASAREFYKVI